MADADHTRTFTVYFSGDQELPPIQTEASGSGTVTWNPDALTATYKFTVQGVDVGAVLRRGPTTEPTDDDVVDVHLHAAPRGEASGVLLGLLGAAADEDDLSVKLNRDGSWTFRGVLDEHDPFSPQVLTFADFAAALNATDAGEDAPLYFNIHTVEYPAGEIRAQWVGAGDYAL